MNRDKTSRLVINFYKKLGTKDMAYLTNKEKDRSILNYILPFLKRSDKILDLACGYGRITILFRKRGYDIEGLDISSNLIKDAREYAKKHKLKIKYKIGDMRDLPYRNKNFDKIICLWSSFNHLLTEKDQSKTISEIYRVLKNEGICIIEMPNGESKWAKEKIKEHGRIVLDVINGIKVINYLHDRKTLRKIGEKSKFKKYNAKFANIDKRRRLVFILEKDSTIE